MANSKISQLTELTSVSDGDFIPVVDTANSQTKKITYNNLKNFTGDVGINVVTAERALDMNGHFRLNISQNNRTAGRSVALIKSDDKTAANLRVEGPVSVTHDLFKNSGVTNGFADNSNHFHTIQKINRITQQVGKGTANERVQEQYYAIKSNNLKNSKAAFWNWHRVSKEIATSSVSLVNLVGWDVSAIQDSSNRQSTSQALFPAGGAEDTTFTFTSGNNPLALNDLLQITIDIDFEGAIVAASLFAKVTALPTADTATVVLYGGNYKSTGEVADGNSQTAVAVNFTVNKIDTSQYIPMSGSANIPVLTDSTRTDTNDTFSITFTSAHGLELNDVVTILTDGDSSHGFKDAEVAFVKEVTSTTQAKFVYGRVFEPSSNLALSNVSSPSVVGVLKGTFDGLHRFTAGDQLMHFNADNEGRYKSYQIGPGSEVGADCIAIGKNVYNKDASTIKIGYDNAMLDIKSDGVGINGDLTLTDSTSKLGIRTSGAPTAALDVNGTIKASDLNIDSQTFFVDSTDNYIKAGAYGDGTFAAIVGAENQPKTTPAFGNNGKVVEKTFIKTFKLQGTGFTGLGTPVAIVNKVAGQYIVPLEMSVFNKYGTRAGTWGSGSGAQATIQIGTFQDANNTGNFAPFLILPVSTANATGDWLAHKTFRNIEGKQYANRDLCIKGLHIPSSEANAPDGQWYIRVEYMLIGESGGFENNVDQTIGTAF